MLYPPSTALRKGSERKRKLPRRELIDDLQNSIADLLIGDADLSAPKDAQSATSFPVAAAMEPNLLFNDVIADEEWRGSFGAQEVITQSNALERLSGTRVPEWRLGILADGKHQRDLLKSDVFVLNVKLPAYEIDEHGQAVSLRYCGVGRICTSYHFHSGLFLRESDIHIYYRHHLGR